MAKIRMEENKQEDHFSKLCGNIISGTISIFLLILVTVFPLILHNSYVDVLKTKYQCYYITILGMLAIILVLVVIMFFVDWKEYHGKHMLRLCTRLHPGNWKSTFCLADIAVIAFWLTLLVSTFQSKYFYESFWGNEGRYSGFFLMTLYVVSYFVISRFWTVQGRILEFFLITSLIVCGIGITDYFQMDILNFRSGIKPEQSTIFTSTLGNINTYTAYVALMLGFTATMFATIRDARRAVWYYVCMVVGFFAIIMGCSDNAYLALGALFGFLPLVLFKSRRGIRRYLLMVATFGTVIHCMDQINQVYAYVVIGLDSLFQILVNLKYLVYMVTALWLIYFATIILDKKRPDKTDETGTFPIRMWSVLLILCVLAICFLIYDANIANNAKRYGSLGNYLVFNDTWGTNRGYIWRKSMELFQEFPLMHKLFGYGPETFGILTTKNFYGDMIRSSQGQIFDNAHNEYLQYLLTTGALGLVTYIVFLAAASGRMAAYRSRNTYTAGCLFAVLCYATQALVNLNLPITTPIMWLLLSVGMAACKT